VVDEDDRVAEEEEVSIASAVAKKIKDDDVGGSESD